MKRRWLWPWVGVLAAALLLVNVNVLGARWYKRWDLTSDRLYTLSGPTRELLASLVDRVDDGPLRDRLREASAVPDAEPPEDGTEEVAAEEPDAVETE